MQRRSPSGVKTGALVHLTDRRLVLILALALLAGFLAYQAPPSAGIAIGWFGDRLFLAASDRLAPDDPASFYGDELTETARSRRSRWTRGEAAIVMRGIGPGPDLTLTLRAQGWPADTLNPRTKQPTVAVDAAGVPIGHFDLTGDWADYTLTIPAHARITDDLTLRLHVSDVFTSTVAYDDLRPKGMRIEYVEVYGDNNAQLLLMRPAQGPLALLTINGLLCLIALAAITRRPTLAFVLTTIMISALAILLAFARVWAAALMPVLTLALALVLLAVYRAAALRLLVALVRRYIWGGALNYGLIALAVAWLGYVAVRATLTFTLPDANTFRDNFPDSLLYSLLGVGLLVLMFVQGRQGLPRLAHAIVRFYGSPRGALALLLLFAAIWIGYEATLIADLPYVGHADYADNAVVARNLAAGRGWVVDYVTQFYRLYNGVTHDQETWPLLQPVWMTPFFWAFGPTDWAAKIPNLIFIAALALLIYLAGARLWDRRVGLTAAVFVLTSHLFFKLVIYTTNDLAFVVFSFAAIYLLYRWTITDRRSITAGLRSNERSPQPPDAGGWRALLGSALFTGLMMLQKPSGVLLAAGMGLWLLTQLWRDYRRGAADRANASERRRSLRALVSAIFGSRWVAATLWGLLALLILSPSMARNISLFETPFYSTESRDAWVLGYSPSWEDIYKVYTTTAGLSETQGLPDHSWVLRWGFDRTLDKLETQVAAMRNYLLPPWRGLPQGLGELLSSHERCRFDAGEYTCDSKALLFQIGAWLAALGIFGALGSRPRLITLLLTTFGPYTLFLITYWHADEERYFVMIMPWLALLAGYALWHAYDRIAAIGDGRWTPVGLALAVAALALTVQPSWPFINEKIQVEPQRKAADIDAYTWLREHTALNDVVMTRLPWQLNWHSERPALMIPNTTSRETFMRIARYYNTRYLVLDTMERPSPTVQRLIDELLDNPDYGFELVYQTKIYDPSVGETKIYRFPPDYGGVAELSP